MENSFANIVLDILYRAAPGVIGTGFVALVVYLYKTTTNNLRIKRSSYSGVWYGSIFDDAGKIKKADKFVVAESRRVASGDIFRMIPHSETERSWSFRGRIQNHSFPRILLVRRRAKSEQRNLASEADVSPRVQRLLLPSGGSEQSLAAPHRGVSHDPAQGQGAFGNGSGRIPRSDPGNEHPRRGRRGHRGHAVEARPTVPMTARDAEGHERRTSPFPPRRVPRHIRGMARSPRSPDSGSSSPAKRRRGPLTEGLDASAPLEPPWATGDDDAAPTGFGEAPQAGYDVGATPLSGSIGDWAEEIARAAAAPLPGPTQAARPAEEGRRDRHRHGARGERSQRRLRPRDRPRGGRQRAEGRRHGDGRGAVGADRLGQSAVSRTGKLWTPHRPERPPKSEGGIRFELVSPYEPKGDQPQAIAELVEGCRARRPLPGAARRHRFGQGPSPWRRSSPAPNARR